MKKYILFLLLILVGAACLINTSGYESFQNEQTETPSIEIKTEVPAVKKECVNSEIEVFADDIANQFDSASKEEIMGWFCEGAELEDILVALQTEKITGYPARDLLEMIASGQSWEEIWKSIGYTTE